MVCKAREIRENIDLDVSLAKELLDSHDIMSKSLRETECLLDDMRREIIILQRKRDECPTTSHQKTQ